MPIKKRSVIKAFTRAPIPASRAFCFAKFTPFVFILRRVFWIFERQICSLPTKFMLFYFCYGKFTSACAAALVR